jgi:hypothetical protein
MEPRGVVRMPAVSDQACSVGALKGASGRFVRPIPLVTQAGHYSFGVTEILSM